MGCATCSVQVAELKEEQSCVVESQGQIGDDAQAAEIPERAPEGIECLAELTGVSQDTAKVEDSGCLAVNVAKFITASRSLLIGLGGRHGLASQLPIQAAQSRHAGTQRPVRGSLGRLFQVRNEGICLRQPPRIRQRQGSRLPCKKSRIVCLPQGWLGRLQCLRE